MAENGESKTGQKKRLDKARREKNDEFYTQLQPIEDELKHYREHFKGKIVLCNCDDPDWSNFWKYFYNNFAFLGLKKLIATHYEKSEPSYKLEFDGTLDIQKTPLKENGDFRSPECIKLLHEADIICTNPPFSLFREYLGQLMEYDKKFLIIGNMNACFYKEIRPFVVNEKMWIGFKPMGTDMLFDVPEHFAKNLVENKKEGSGYKIINGEIKARASAIWFTNLDVSKRHENIKLHKSYTPEDYPKYDNYDAIEVSKVLDIPYDYDGEMGVPITFLDKYNPDQFDIIGFHRDIEKTDGKMDLYLKGEVPYARIIIKHKQKG